MRMDCDSKQVDAAFRDRSTSKDVHECVLCATRKQHVVALTYCEQCEEYLCDKCTKRHKTRTATKVHSPISIETFKRIIAEKNKVFCDPCKDESIEIKAETNCEECQENLCQECSSEHSSRKATKDHKLLPISRVFEQEITISKLLCSPCKDYKNINEQALNFCDQCDEYLCDNCSRRHKTRKPTMGHLLLSVKELQNKKKDHVFSCDECAFENREIDAEKYCTICIVYLCSSCERRHKQQIATKSHTLLSIVFSESQMKIHCDQCKLNNILQNSASFCKTCSRSLCQTCTRSHRTEDSTSVHEVTGLTNTFETNPNSQKEENDLCIPCFNMNTKTKKEVYCIDCREDMCNNCAKVHTMAIPDAINHTLVPVVMKETCTLSSQQISCGICLHENKNRFAKYFCQDCQKGLCDDCLMKHKTFRVSKHHKVIPVNDIAGEKQASYKQIGMVLPTTLPNQQKTLDLLTSPIEENDMFPAPVFLNAISVSADTIITKWKIPDSEKSIASVEIRYRPSLVNSPWKKEITHIQNTYTVKGLQPATSYEFQVRALYDQEWGPYSEISEPIVTSQVFLDKPTLVEAIGDRITIQWKTSEGSCEKITHFEIRYRRVGDSKWQVTSTADTKENLTIGGLQGQTNYEFKVRPIYENGEGPYGPVSDHIKTKTPYPGKPKKVQIGTDQISINWKRPEGENLKITHYDIRYRIIGNDKWEVVSTKKAEESATVYDLKGSTKYEFQVRAVYDDMEGQYGHISAHIETEMTLARMAKAHAIKTNDAREIGHPEIYKIPLDEDPSSVNAKAKYRRCIFGKPDLGKPEEKTIMLVGATGAGKSTLIDGMINYILDVSLDDEFRYTLINVTREEQTHSGNQAVSQTKWITNYVIHLMKGCKIHYTLNIIDTPGFGDTAGITRDRQIIDQMRELFTTKGSQGVATIDAVCFVTQAPLARLSPTQKYIFESILSLFGRDIANNIFVLITFADGNTPPVLSALKAANIPFVDTFVFNNSALFANPQGDFASMFWKMGKQSFFKFFSHLLSVKKRSLQMTAEVLVEREKLETRIQGLRPQITIGLNNLEELRKTRQICIDNKEKIKENENFEYDMTETRQRKIDLATGEHVTNCITCNTTCHYPCYIPKDKDKSRCASMSNGICTVCPGKCPWDKHFNNPYRFETYSVTLRKTYEETKKKYEKGKQKARTLRQVLELMKNDFNKLRKHVGSMLEEVGKSLNRLSEIGLRPNPLSNVDYIDILIEAEKQEGRAGFHDRITVLLNLRKDAEIMGKKGGSYDPWGHIDMDDFEVYDEDNENQLKQLKEKCTIS